MLDLCNQPGFVRDAYINMDCRIERSNLFEGVAATLSKAAFPVQRPLVSAHVLALDGLLSVMSALSRGYVSASILRLGHVRLRTHSQGRQYGKAADAMHEAPPGRLPCSNVTGELGRVCGAHIG